MTAHKQVDHLNKLYVHFQEKNFWEYTKPKFDPHQTSLDIYTTYTR